MNALIVGSDKTPILQYASEHFLFIDDGPLIDTLKLPERRTITFFDAAKHSFNPVKDINYLKAREIIDVLNAAFPEGESTLTRKNSNFVLLRALLDTPSRLGKLSFSTEGASKEGVLDARQKIETLLLSPVLKRVLDRPTNFSFKGTIIAKLDRAKLGDFDAFVLANFLISQFPGTVIIPDFRFYGCASHINLVRQNRLVAGITSFDDLPKMRNQLLLIDRKIASRCTPDDAKLLARFAGIAPDTNAHADFIQQSIGLA